MPVIMDDVVNLVIFTNEKISNSEEVLVNEYALTNPRVDDHVSKARRGKDKKVQQVFTPIP